MLIESHEGPAGSDYQVNAALELFVGDEAHVDHVKLIGEGADALHVSTLAAAIGAQGPLQRLHLHHRRRGGAQPAVPQVRRRGDASPTFAARPCSTGGSTPTRRSSPTHIARGCQSREVFKTVLDDEAHGVFQGRIIVRQGAQKTDAKMMTQALLLSDRRRGRQQAGAGDLRRRRAVRPRRHRRRARRGAQFYLMARGIPAAEAEALADPGVPRRGDRGHRACRPARGADGAGRGVAQGTGSPPCMHALTNGTYDVNRIRADFPILATQVYGKPLVYLDNAASAQKPQAVLDRLDQRLHRGIRQRASRPALSRQRGDRSLRRRAREGRGLPQCRAARKRSSSPATPPRRSTLSPTRSGASASRRATRSCSRSWSTTPTSCPGISCASARAR